MIFAFYDFVFGLLVLDILCQLGMNGGGQLSSRLTYVERRMKERPSGDPETNREDMTEKDISKGGWQWRFVVFCDVCGVLKHEKISMRTQVGPSAEWILLTSY